MSHTHYVTEEKAKLIAAYRTGHGLFYPNGVPADHREKAFVILIASMLDAGTCREIGKVKLETNSRTMVAFEYDYPIEEPRASA